MERLDTIAASLPKRLGQCADFLRHNIHLVAVSTVADLSAGAGVQPSAFMRFCQALGFSGFSEMQALFRAEYAQLRPDYAERLSQLRERGAQGPGGLAADFVEAGHKSLISLMNSLDEERLGEACELLAAAGTIHLVGLRRAFAIVSYMGYMLDKMQVPTVIHRTSGQIESDHAIRPGDCLFAVSFAPFSQETLQLAARTADRGIPVVALSDTADCPLRDTARVLLIAREVDVGAFRAPIAAMTLATSLTVAVGGRRKDGD
ncbi:MurR/RpiR family transcriptional regulator [Aurantimonas sp. VKM B-3413]|uniref:MurR/RpiR family transcriptional regulator n=1 Tax=Aurantimonas sp. VKM B-3413 TaxID=2779401 RepID=UPI001E495FE8|nr:MurR/RpiR family transcriptional regulator [Aurantimonas sp. VKM B-3413]MCB8837133.1 MurR/RpiR family transcriptional regulator [Aurantimonas sp. VKM B-3413]